MTSLTPLPAATDFSVDGNLAVRRAALVVHEQGAVASCGESLRNWFAPTIDIDLEAAHALGALRRMVDFVLGSVSGGRLSETACDIVTVPQPRSCDQRAWLLDRPIDRKHVRNLQACAAGWQQAQAPWTAHFSSRSAPTPDSEGKAP